jgi:glycine hydroxymethyltransferase
MVMCRGQYAKDLDRTVLPGIQGGPLMHVIAAKAVAFREAQTQEWRAYQAQIVKNAKAFAEAMLARGFRLVSGGTDTHLILVDLTSRSVTGKDAQEALDRAWITVNKNGIPFDTKGPMVTSGIRIGTAALTTRGMGPEEMRRIATVMADVLESPEDRAIGAKAHDATADLSRRFPLYPELGI